MSGCRVSKAFSSASFSKAEMMPRPAHPTPGGGPPASTHNTPPYPAKTMSCSLRTSLFALMLSRTVGIFLPPMRFVVESALGSQPTCITRKPPAAKAAAKFDVVVDLPMPPLPYMAIFLIRYLPIEYAYAVIMIQILILITHVKKYSHPALFMLVQLITIVNTKNKVAA